MKRQRKQFAKRHSNLKKLVAESKLTKPSGLFYFLEGVARNLGDKQAFVYFKLIFLKRIFFERELFIFLGKFLSKFLNKKKHFCI